MAKTRPMNLVSRNLLSAKKTPPQDSSASNRPGAQELDQSHASPSGRKLMRNHSQDPKTYTQERQQDDTLFSSTGKLVRSGESAGSANTRKLERGDDIQIARRRLEIHNMQVSDHRYLEKVFKNLRQKLNLAEEARVLELKTSVLIWRLFVSTTMKAAVHLGPNYTEILGSIQENKLRGTPEFVRYHAEMDIGTLSRNSGCITDWLDSSLMDEIYACARPSDHVDESTRPLRFRLMLGKMQEHSEASVRRNACGRSADPGPATHERDRTVTEHKAGDSVPRSQDSVTRAVQNLRI